MNNDFVAEILRATGSLRSGDPSGATAIIQAALAAGGLAAPDAAAPDRPRATGARRRKPLGEVVRTLAEGRSRLPFAPGLPGRAPSVPDLPVPEGASFRDATYAGAAGARRYRLYVPASAADGLQGLIVMLHGCTQTPEDFAAGTGMNALAEQNRLLVAYPAQTGGHNTMSCWNWFRPGDQMRGTGEPAIIAGLTESIRAEFAVPPGRVFVAGLSAGGAMAAIMGETYPDLYAAIGVHSGLAHGSASDVASAFSAMRGQDGIGARPTVGRADGPRPRMIVFHGLADSTVHPGNARRIVAQNGGGEAMISRSERAAPDGGRGYTRMEALAKDGTPLLECWMVEGAPHAWSGGDAGGTYTDPLGPDASAEMVRFFLAGSAPAAH